jgi:hypothetical protein
MSASITRPTAGHWPPNVLEFAAQRQLAGLLDPLRLALDRLFPDAHSVQVRLEEDPEIRDDRHLVFDVRVSRADVPDFGAAKRRWHEELFRLCQAPLVCLFRLTLIRVTG